MSRTRALWWLAALCFGLAFQGARPLADPDEGRYAEAAREMLVSGDWLTPSLDGRPHWTKPLGTYWVALAGIRALGVGRAGVRVGVGLAFAGWILAAAALGRLIGGDSRAGIWSGVALATSVAPFVGGSLLTPDVFIAAFDAAAAVCIVRALEEASVRRAALRWTWATLGLGFLFKGPPALLPLVGLAAAWRRRRDPAPQDRVAGGWGLLLFAGLGLSWALPLAVRSPGVLAALVRRELFQAPFVGALGRNLPFWTPAAVLAAGSLPWGVGVLFSLQRCRRGLLGEPGARFLAGWCAGGLLVFTMSRSRMPLYVLPLATTIAVPAGVVVAGWVRAGRARRWAAAALAVVSGGLLLGARAAGDRLPHYRQSEDLAARVKALMAPGDAPVLLQSAFLPGLAFALQSDLVTVAMTPTERRAPHDLDFEDLAPFLAAQERGVVAVGRPEAFASLPAEWRVVEPVIDPASRFGVARLRRAPMGDLYSPRASPAGGGGDCPQAAVETSGDDLHEHGAARDGRGGGRRVGRGASPH